MLSKRFLETLEAVCSIRDPSLLFGGMQIVLCGDFRQLAPVPNASYNEEGSHCFESEIFNSVFTHRIVLTQVVRQHEAQLIKSIQEVSDGCPSEETIAYIKTLSRPLVDNDNTCVKLFSKNDLVDDVNRECVLDFPGQLFEFRSEDSGDKKRLHSILAPPVLWLKHGSPVILLRNLSDKLVNGLMGTVYELADNEPPLVEFPNIGTVPIERFTFTVYDPKTNKDIACRKQYPLKLAYALTIHKAQGMTLDMVEVDCRDIFQPGQLGVAMGRARTSAGLCVTNFSEKACIQQPRKVSIAMSENINNVPQLEDKTCCIRKHRTHHLCIQHPAVKETSIVITEPVDMDLEEDFDEDFDLIIREINAAETTDIELPEDLCLKTLLENIKEKNVLTEIQAQTNHIINLIDENNFQVFVKKEYVVCKSLLNEVNTSQRKTMGKFYPSIHQHLNSVEYTMNCLLLFDMESTFTSCHKHICFNISSAIRKYLLSKKVLEVDPSKRQLCSRSVTTASRDRIRYVGGFCIAKTLHKLLNKKKTLRYSLKKSDIQAYQEIRWAADILYNLKEEEYIVLASTNEPDSLIDVSRRQNVNRSLTNISDELFHFFVHLTEKCVSLLTDVNFNSMGSKMFQHCLNNIMDSQILYNEFFGICFSKKNEALLNDSVNVILNEMILQVSQVENIYNIIIKKFLMVIFSQFRKDLLDSFNIQKKMAHRKQVRVSVKACDSKKRKQNKTQNPKKVKSTHHSEFNEETNKVLDVDSCTLHKTVIEPSTSCESVNLQSENQQQMLNVKHCRDNISDEDSDDENVKCKICFTVEKGMNG